MNDLERLLRPRSHAVATLWLVAAALVAVAAWLTMDVYARFNELARERAIIARLQDTSYRRPPPKMSREDRERDRRLSAMEAERSFRWYPVFRGLEEASSEDIELLEFAPDKVNRTFVLRGEARDGEALLAYLSSLSEQPGFNDVHLAHQKLERRDNLTVQSFEIRGCIR